MLNCSQYSAGFKYLIYFYLLSKKKRIKIAQTVDMVNYSIDL